MQSKSSLREAETFAEEAVAEEDALDEEEGSMAPPRISSCVGDPCCIIQMKLTTPSSQKIEERSSCWLEQASAAKSFAPYRSQRGTFSATSAYASS